MSKARDLADFISTGSILSDGTIESTEISGVTADATEINKLDGLTADTTELNTLDGVTATTAELNKLAGTTATTSDFDKLSNVTASATELNYMTGATSSIQSQLDNISVTSGSLTKSFTSGESATITLAQSITPAPVVSVTKEVAQTGQSSKGAWDVNATASNYDLHNTAYATTLGFSGWDISTATYSQSFNVSSQDTTSQGLFFKPDGTKMYMLGDANNSVFEYNLTTAWDVSTASYSSNSFSVASQEATPFALFFKSDGLKMYIVGITNDTVYEYNLSTAWDISTASYASKSFSVSSQETVPRGLSFKSDGTKMFVLGGQNDAVNEYNLSTAWDVSTATYSQNFSVATQETGPMGLFFRTDGTKMYVVGSSGQDVNEYNLSTAWDVSTASFVQNFVTSPQSTFTSAVFFETNGTKMFVLAVYDTLVLEYDLSASLTLGTGSFASTDVGKRIQGNGGDVILTSTAGAYDTTGGSDFTDTSTIASGSWTMHGLKSAGDADGLTIVNKVEAPAALSTWSDDSNSLASFGAYETSPEHAFFNNNGTEVYILGSGSDALLRYYLSTPYDLSTGTLGGNNSIFANQMIAPRGWDIDPTGTTLFVTGESNIAGQPTDGVWAYTMSTPWDLYGSISYTGNSINLSSLSASPAPRGGRFSSDGRKYYLTNYDANTVVQLNLNTAYDITSYQSLYSMYHGAQDNYPTHIDFNGDGTELYVLGVGFNKIYKWNLSTAWDLSSATYSGDSIASSTITGGSNISGFRFYNSNTKLLAVIGTSTTLRAVNIGEIIAPTSQYHIGVTNTNGQIDSAYWIDINSMTADQSLGDGEAYYAVSTDDRTTWSVAKASDGVRPIVRNNAGTWQYNSDAGGVAGYDISNASYDSVSLSHSTQTGSNSDLAINNDGTKLYVIGSSSVFQYNLSTAYDLSTASYSNLSFSVSSQEATPLALRFKSDGTKMYVSGFDSTSVHQYSLSTAFDISTASYDSVSFSLSSQGQRHQSLAFSSDGTKMYTGENDSDRIYQYTLSTAWDLSTASYSSNSFSVSSQLTLPHGLDFNSDGTKMFVLDESTDTVYQYTLSTAWDITTASYDSVSFSVSAQGTDNNGVVFSGDGTTMYIASSGKIDQYTTETVGFGTNTTWTNATTNDEFYALQQALGATFVNRMDKTQLDAVADGSHFTLGNTLDLMIALKQDTASASLPTSDGVTINYDAEALNQGAVLGTDYDFDFPANNKVRITSNAAQNLKIRVV